MLVLACSDVLEHDASRAPPGLINAGGIVMVAVGNTAGDARG